MSFENPTPLNVGMSGTLNGWRVRVAGRIVMGVQDGGETYFWNEFHLVDDSGNSATLVFEETDDGPEWKLFRDFTPAQPMTAREAASKQVGDLVNLDGTPTPVTLVGCSRVFFIEGSAPEGVENGDIANYFNADTGSRMLVASWTGDEIEFYEGLDAPADSVADAFGFPRGAAASRARSGFSPDAATGFRQETATKSNPFVKIVLVALAAAILFAAYSCFRGSRTPRVSSIAGPRPKASAPAQRLPLGAQGSLAQHSYVVDGHAVVEVARVSGRHDRREYFLRDETRENSLLVNGLSGGAQEWHLLRPVPAPPEITPYDAAAKRRGTPFNISGQTLHVVELFQAKTRAFNGQANGAALPGVVQYGFVARDAGNWLIARWTENQIQFFRGGPLPEAEVLAALTAGPEKPR